MAKGSLPKPRSATGTPWHKRAVVYQVYPRSFKDSTGNGLGDLNGIIEKLDYLNDGTENSLGVEAIWLSPIYVSPMKDFGYDVANYKEIDPLFGTMSDFERLVKAAHKRGIRVIMDFIPNHSSDQHPWFLESRADKANPKRDWYIWHDPRPSGGPPNNWQSVFGGPAWTLDKVTGQYYMHSFLSEQPDLNWRNSKVREEFRGIIDFWLHKGVDGFRSDAVYFLIKDEQFRDEPINPNYVPGRDDPYNELMHIYTQGREELFSAIDSFSELLASHDKDLYMMLEAYVGVTELQRFYGNCRTRGIVAPFNFNLLSLPWSASAYRRFVDDFESRLDEKDWPNYVLGNHDKPRVATRLGPQRSRLAALLLFTFRGMPILYYGDEIGMTDVPIPLKRVQDPWEKSAPGIGLGRDPERTPMQWDSTESAGFTDGDKPWLPVSKYYRRFNVKAEQKNSTSSLTLHKRLIHLRANSCALLEGSYRSVDTGSEYIFGFMRECEHENMLILANFSPRRQRVVFLGKMNASVVIDTQCERSVGEAFNLDGGMLRGNEAVLLRI